MSLKSVMGAAIDWTLDKGIYAARSFIVNDLAGRRQGPVILTASQNLAIVAARTNLTAVGPELAMDGFTRVTLWGNLAPNTATGIRFACYGRHTTGGTNHCMPIYNPVVTAAPYYVKWGPEEFYYDDTTNAVDFALTWDIANTFPFLQFGAAATAQPGAVGVLTNVNVTYGWGS